VTDREAILELRQQVAELQAAVRVLADTAAFYSEPHTARRVASAMAHATAPDDRTSTPRTVAPGGIS